MATSYRIFGMELSPYSVKVRSYFRYKGIPHEWIVRGVQNQDEFQKHAKLPLVPLVVGSDGTVLQDSTPIIEAMEAQYPEPSITPKDPAMAFLSALVEEYADEWGNKPMFHYRWAYAPDAWVSADRLAHGMNPSADEATVGAVRDMVFTRMTGRLGFVGSSESTRGTIEGSFERLLTILEKHLAARPYLFGGRPSLADFGLWGQVYNAAGDPTPGKLVRARAPKTLEWIARMLSPKAEGEFEGWDALHATLLPLLSEEIGALFLPWSVANARALAAGQKELSVELRGTPFTQEVQKYHAKSLKALRDRYRAVKDRTTLDHILERAGCLAALQAEA
jgi:glutathione S-transferase